MPEPTLEPSYERLRATYAAFRRLDRTRLVVPLPGLRGRAAKAAAVQVFRAFGADLDGPENLWSIVLVEYQDGARVGRHAYSAASSTWRKLPTDPEPPQACPRCGGHGIESALDAYCYACGRLGKRAEAYWRARGKTDG